jgi:O-antigen ligase
LYTTFFWRGGVRRVQNWVSAIVLLGILAIALTTSVGQVSLTRFFDPEIFEAGVSTRTASMQLGLEATLLHPVFGVGFNGFTRVAYDLRGEALFRQFTAVYLSNASNQFVQTMVEGGIVGLVLFVYLLVVLLRDGWQARVRVGEAHRSLFEGMFLWTSAIVLGDHASVWLLPGFLPCVYLLAIGAITAAQTMVHEVPAERRAPAPGFVLARYAR